MQGLSTFEAFVPSKSKILGLAPPPVISNSSIPKKKREGGITNLFQALKGNRHVLTVAHRVEKDSQALIPKDTVESNKNASELKRSRMPPVSKVSFGCELRDRRLLNKIDIEANFDIRPLLMDALVDRNTDHVQHDDTELRMKLRNWADAQSSWIYPDQPVSAQSMKFGESIIGAELGLHCYWQEPSPADVSNIGMIRRRRLKWQAALSSALDALLTHDEATTETSHGDLIPSVKRKSDSFYVIGSDTESNSNTSSDANIIDLKNPTPERILPARTLSMSAVFLRERGISCQDAVETKCIPIKPASDDMFSCIITGAKKSFIDRLIELGAVPSEIVEESEVKRRNAHNHKVSHFRDLSALNLVAMSISCVWRILMQQLLFTSAARLLH